MLPTKATFKCTTKGQFYNMGTHTHTLTPTGLVAPVEQWKPLPCPADGGVNNGMFWVKMLHPCHLAYTRGKVRSYVACTVMLDIQSWIVHQLSFHERSMYEIFFLRRMNLYG